jgi:hypothetical protein
MKHITDEDKAKIKPYIEVLKEFGAYTSSGISTIPNCWYVKYGIGKKFWVADLWDDETGICPIIYKISWKKDKKGNYYLYEHRAKDGSYFEYRPKTLEGFKKRLANTIKILKCGTVYQKLEDIKKDF